MRSIFLSREQVFSRRLPLFEHVLTVYSENLDPNDYRFAGLYNNMALSYEDTGASEKAEAFFGRALDVLERLPGTNCGASGAPLPSFKTPLSAPTITFMPF